LAQGALRFFGVFGNEQQIKGGAAVNDELSAAVDNHSTRAGNSLDAHAVILRKKGVPFAINDLKEKEPGGERPEYQNQDKVKNPRSPAQLRGAILPSNVGQ
jgi:hypothetical protein